MAEQDKCMTVYFDRTCSYEDIECMRSERLRVGKHAGPGNGHPMLKDGAGPAVVRHADPSRRPKFYSPRRLLSLVTVLRQGIRSVPKAATYRNLMADTQAFSERRFCQVARRGGMADVVSRADYLQRIKQNLGGCVVLGLGTRDLQPLCQQGPASPGPELVTAGP